MMNQPERKKTESFPARLSPSLLSRLFMCVWPLAVLVSSVSAIAPLLDVA